MIRNVFYLLCSMQSRLSSDHGLTFKELAYQIFQAIDFLHLYKRHDVGIQLGGSDQWGNISAGLHLINKKIPENNAAGLAIALLSGQNGKKMGKSDGNALWLDPFKTCPYDIYSVQPDLATDNLYSTFIIWIVMPPKKHPWHYFFNR